MALATRSDATGGEDNLSEYTAAFLEDCRLRSMTRKTVWTYAHALRSFERFLTRNGIRDVRDIDRDMMREYIRSMREERTLKFKTIENQMAAISSFFEYLVYEEVLESNIALSVRKRYVRRYKAEGPGDSESRQLITVEQLKSLVDSILIPRDKAIILVLAKTGIRRDELVTIDIGDVDFAAMKIRLKPKAKRSNKIVFFDEECAGILQDWLLVRKRYDRRGSPALFITEGGGRVNGNMVYEIVSGHASRNGLHNPASSRLEDHFGPHCLRHWFTTFLLRNGMPRELVKELRGDIRKEAIDLYNHVDEEQLRTEYMRHMPKIGVR